MPEVEQNKNNKRVEDKKTTTNKYPHEKYWMSQGGIKFVYGDEPGKEFIRMVHPSGTYSEIYPDGKSITMNIGDSKQYNKSGITLSVDENNDLHIHGHNNIKIGGGSHIEVVGNAGIAVGGDVALVGMGNFNFDVKNAYFGVRGNLGIRVEGNAKLQIDGSVKLTSGTTMDIISGGRRTDIAPNIEHNPGGGSSWA